MKSTWLKGALLLLIVLGSGIAIGAGFNRMHTRIPAHAVVVHMPPADVLRRLDRELDLDSAQYATIAGVIHRRQASIDSVWAEVQPQVRAVVLATLLEIMAPLNPQQKARYREMVNQVHPGILDGVPQDD